jgi:aminobenzoyl-glutamate transport protein
VSYILLWSLFFFAWVFVLGMPVGPAAPTFYAPGAAAA